MLVTGCWLLVTGYWPLATGLLFATVYSLLRRATGYSILDARYWMIRIYRPVRMSSSIQYKDQVAIATSYQQPVTRTALLAFTPHPDQRTAQPVPRNPSQLFRLRGQERRRGRLQQPRNP